MNKIKKAKRLLQIAKELNVGIEHLIAHLQNKGIEVEARPNAKVSADGYELLLEKFSSDKLVKEESEKRFKLKKEKEESVLEEAIDEQEEELSDSDDDTEIVKEEKEEEKEKPVKEIIKEVKKEQEIKNKDEEVVKEVKAVKTDKKPEKNKEEKDTVEKEIKKEKKKDTKKDEKEKPKELIKKDDSLKIKGKIDLNSLNQKTKPDKKTAKQRKEEREKRKQDEIKAKEKAKIAKIKAEKDAIISEKKRIEEEKIKEEQRIKDEKEKNFIKTKVEILSGPKVVGKIKVEEKKKKDNKDNKEKNANIENRRKKRRKRIRKPINTNTATVQDKNKNKGRKQNYKKKEEVSEEDVQKKVRDTLAKLTNKSKKTSVKHRRKKREEVHQQIQEDIQQQEKEKSILKVTEFISANELANFMDVSVNKVIATSFELGKMVTINSRLDAEIIGIIAEEYGFEIEFISATEGDDIDTYEDKEEELKPRSPIVTVMGHVDHGKTSLLDYIRDANVIAGEAGGITQHIGAYSVKMKDGKRVTFLDTPGHEAFTAMRARGASVTDIAIIIIAADDKKIMPQTEEAISHAKAAQVPIIFAINKIDKPGADPERIKQELAEKNMLVESWGGKYQSVDISAKKGTNVDALMEEVTLAAEMLELKANPDRPAKGTVIEAELDKGRGYLSTILVQSGTLKIGDIVLAGAHSGKIKAMYDERNNKVQVAGPSIPVQILGLDGAPQAGDIFYVMKTDKEAREIADKNKRLQREQTLRTNKHITLDEIGRRIQLGSFQEINIIIKGDVIGSVEAIADSLVKLGTDEIQVKVIHKGVGQISEADVMLAAASDAIIVGFQVRPALNAKKLAEKEEIDIRLYSIIYQAIEEMKSAMEGMLSPEIKEEITATVEVRDVFKVSKSGKVAGCFVLDGKIHREDKIRLIRDGIVKYQGELGSLRRFKDDVKEVVSGMECGLNIENFNDIKIGDIVESFKETEIARTL